MKKALLLVAIAVASVMNVAQADDSSPEHNAVIASDMMKALEAVSKSQEFLEWEVGLARHIQDGVMIIAKQAKNELSPEEQAILKQIIIAFEDFIKVSGEVYLALRLAPTQEARLKIDQDYFEKEHGKAEALHKSLEFFLEFFKNLPVEVVKQNGNRIEILFFTWLQHLCITLSAVLPDAANEFSQK